jgi:hypothetical protein
MDQVVRELFKPARKNFPRRRTIVKGLFDLWQTDLAEFIPYAKSNKGNKYILFVIDCFSKYLWTEPVKNKTGPEITKAMRNIFKRAPKVPKNLQSDMGKEYYNASFKKLMEGHGINHYSSFSTIKASMAERVIRTIKTEIYKAFSLRGRYVWIDKLKEVTDAYNNKIHRTIKMKPKDVTQQHEKHLLETVYSRIKIVGKAKLKVGDVVRISKHKTVFDKGYKPSWTNELFKIVKVKVTNPATYLLEDMKGHPIQGGFYEHELQKAKYSDVYLVEKVLRRKGNKLYVKWMDGTNSWINKSDVV